MPQLLWVQNGKTPKRYYYWYLIHYKNGKQTNHFAGKSKPTNRWPVSRPHKAPTNKLSPEEKEAQDLVEAVEADLARRKKK
ncbi:MAG: hypothetical protein KGH74_05505 [Candidatus Micrarchaeota archaeon]|nr:hypothetical protein [Candidatus Micrarchaeota archaeon]